MNKSTIVFAALALLAASCTKTELVTGDAQSAQRGIGFSAYTAKHTKAAQTDVVTGNFDSFEVSAIGNGATYFDNVTFTKNSTVWESDPVYFWPAYKLNFYAYNTPANGHFTRAISPDAPQTLSFKPSTVLAEQEDLVAAYAPDQTDPSGATPLTFNHYLTQLVVNAKSSNSNYTVEVSGVKVANLKDSLTFTISTGNAAVSAGAVDQDYKSEFEGKTLTSDATEVMVATGNGKWYLVPQTVTAWDQKNNKTNSANGTYLALKVKITSKGGAQIYPKSGNDPAWMAVPVPDALKFEQGKKYNVTLDFFKNKGAGYVDPEVPSDLDGNGNADDDKGMSILGGAITFNATVTPWEDVNITIEL